MGMFDDITCKYPLPHNQDGNYQTKSMDPCVMDNYEIREDGTLWKQEYDIEDKSDAALWKKAHPGKRLPKKLEGLAGEICGSMSRVNCRWVQITDFTGEIRFYDSVKPADKKPDYGDETYHDWRDRAGWVEYSAYFKDGQLQQMNLTEYKAPQEIVPE